MMFVLFKLSLKWYIIIYHFYFKKMTFKNIFVLGMDRTVITMTRSS